MAKWYGDVSYFTCDFCDAKVEGKFDCPEGWHFLALGSSPHLENADDVYHFCTKEHRKLFMKRAVPELY